MNGHGISKRIGLYHLIVEKFQLPTPSTSRLSPFSFPISLSFIAFIAFIHSTFPFTPPNPPTPHSYYSQGAHKPWDHNSTHEKTPLDLLHAAAPYSTTCA
jgi:hypothetical protein